MRVFLLQPAATGAAACFKQWQNLCRPEDVTVLMGYSALALTAAHTQFGYALYCLETEAALLPVDVKTQVQILDYVGLAQLLLKTKQAITLV